jgi:sialate O-acetylesterase
MKRAVFGLSLLMVIASLSAEAAVRLPGFFTDNMVLQRDRDVPLWGWADPGETVTVEFAGRKVSAKADKTGKFSLKLKPMQASSENRKLVFSSDKGSRVELVNVVVGDVWICSGQSNMEMTQSAALNAAKEAEKAEFPMIRHMKAAHNTSLVPLDDLKAQWVICTPVTVKNFTAVGYYFGRELHRELGVPIGLMESSWSGTKKEPWIPDFAFGDVPELKSLAVQVAENNPKTPEGKNRFRIDIDRIKDWIERAESSLETGKRLPEVPAIGGCVQKEPRPAMMFNAMINPLVPYAVRGAILYQGELGWYYPNRYFFKNKALIEGWRKRWGYDFPFYFVQLANHGGPHPMMRRRNEGAKIREAQLRTLTLPNTGMAVTIDIGDAKRFNSKNKQDVGKRLALWALAREHGRNKVESGPIYRDMKIEGKKIRISFDYVGGGLMVGEKKGLEPARETKGEKLENFAIAGEDRKWVRAQAVIEGETVVVTHDRVDKPVAVRYAYSWNPQGCNLYNKEGLPASPFRTDDW